MEAKYACRVISLILIIFPLITPRSIHPILLFSGMNTHGGQLQLFSGDFTENRSYTTYDAGGFLLVGDRFGITRIYLGPVGSFTQSVATSNQASFTIGQVGGELRFDVNLDLAIKPFTRLQYGYAQINGKNVSYPGTAVQIEASGYSFQWAGGVFFPWGNRVQASLEFGVTGGSLGIKSVSAVTAGAAVVGLDKLQPSGFLFGLSIGYIFGSP